MSGEILPKKSEFSSWYGTILELADIIDNRYPIKGCIVWKPYGFEIRQRVIEIIRKLLNETGHKECLFPLLIPESIFKKEAEHIAGFEGEVFWVTQGGLEKLNEKLVLRPTSETAIYPMFEKWIRSHRDLPLKIYQIVSVFRYETKHTRPLLRIREITTFKEAHTAHATAEDAEKQIEEAINIYKKFFDSLCIPYIISKRPDWDKFAGAEYTIAFDTIFPNGRSLQIGTVHNLGQNFAKAFEIKYLDIDGKEKYVYQTCYGVSDRIIASLLVIHGDDRGLCLLPKIAPIQVVVVPIPYKGKDEEINSYAKQIYEELKKEFRVALDDRKEIRPGKKFYEWELKGVPVRVEIGPRDVEQNKVTVFRRDKLAKEQINREELADYIRKLFQDIEENLRKKAWEEFKRKIKQIKNESEILEATKDGVAYANICDECKKAVKDLEERLKIKVLGFWKANKDRCILCKRNTEQIVYFGKSY